MPVIVLNAWETAVAASSIYYDTIIADTPIAYWRLGESGGSPYPQASDEIGTTDLTWVGAPVLASPGAIANDPDTAVAVDGNDYAIRNVSNYRSTDNVGSIEGWIKVDATATGRNAWFSIGSNSASRYIFCSYEESTNGIRFSWRDAGTATHVEYAHDIKGDGGYHHVVLVSTGTEYKLYLDGIERALTVVGGTNNGAWLNDLTETGNITIGSDYVGSVVNYPFDGSIDEVAYYDYELTAAKVLEHYIAGTSQYYAAVRQDNPTAYWRLGETSGTTADNEIDITNDGTYAGGFTLDQDPLVPGETDRAAAFNGTSGTGVTAASTGLRHTYTYSIEAWVNITAYNPSNAYILSCAGVGDAEVDNYLYGLSVDPSGYLRFFHENGAGVDQTGTTTNPFAKLDLGTTYHVVMVASHNIMHFYVNGVFADSIIIPEIATGGSNGIITIAGDPVDNDLNGIVDEVAIYDYQLSLEQIESHYTAATQYDIPGLFATMYLGDGTTDEIYAYDLAAAADGNLAADRTIGSFTNTPGPYGKHMIISMTDCLLVVMMIQ